MGSSHGQSILLNWRQAAGNDAMISSSLKETNNPASILEESLQNGHFLGQDAFSASSTGNAVLGS